MKRVILP